TLNSFSCNAFGGTIVSRGELNLQEMLRPRFGLSLDMSNVNGHMLLSEFTSFGSRIFGTLAMQSTMRGALDDTLGLRPETLEGQGTIRISEGKLVGVQVNKAIASRLSLPSLEEIAFSDWSNTFTIRDGRFQIKDLTIRGSQADYTVNGSQGLDGTLDYTLGLVLPREASDRVMVAGFAGDALNMFKDTDGRFRFDFGVTGTTDNPEVALQTDAARRRLEEIARQKITEESKRLKDQAKKKGEELLDKLLKKK
ncbi:MAG: AsmA-like C-terminal region-containing protein, partial [Ignavibacteria bacterium]|nr:AsmA-like C-terminal region-containing protein [Ignavibacteria bacterium]